MGHFTKVRSRVIFSLIILMMGIFPTSQSYGSTTIASIVKSMFEQKGIPTIHFNGQSYNGNIDALTVTYANNQYVFSAEMLITVAAGVKAKCSVHNLTLKVNGTSVNTVGAPETSHITKKDEWVTINEKTVIEANAVCNPANSAFISKSNLLLSSAIKQSKLHP